MPRGRRPGSPDTRADILAAARTRFASAGFSGTTMRAVAADAGVDAALVHHYFGTKDDLFVAALELPVDIRAKVAPVIAEGPDGAGERLVRTLLLLVFTAFFVVPLVSLLNFSTKDVFTGERTGAAWRALVEDPTMSEAIRTSLTLAALTVVGMVVLLVPTMIWVRLRVPRATRLVEFLCLLPLTIPALVIVVGVKNVYAWVDYFFGDTPLTLSFAYVVLVLPYAYRSIDASLSGIDARTLAEAARSLGAGWFTVITRVIVPNIWPGILSATFVAIALVLGEYTFASLLNYQTLPVAIVLLGKSDAPTSMAAALGSILLAFVLLLVLSLLDRRRHVPRSK